MKFNVRSIGYNIWKTIRFEHMPKPKSINIEGIGFTCETTIDKFNIDNITFQDYWLTIRDGIIKEEFKYNKQIRVTMEQVIGDKEINSFLEQYLPKIGIVHRGQTDFRVSNIKKLLYEDTELKALREKYGWLNFNGYDYQLKTDDEENLYYFESTGFQKVICNKEEVQKRLDSQIAGEELFDLFEKKIKNIALKEMLRDKSNNETSSI